MADYSQQQDPIYEAEEATEHVTPTAQDRGLLHHNKPTDTGYGGQSTAGTKKGGSMAEKVKGALHSITGQKKHDEGVTSPTDAAKTHHTTTYDEGATGTAGHEKIGCMDKVKNLVAGQKPSPGTSGAKHLSPTSAEGQPLGVHLHEDYVQGGVPSYGGETTQGWPQPVHPSSHATPGATYTDPNKKEGMMSKVMDKLHMGEHHQKDANKNVPTQY